MMDLSPILNSYNTFIETQLKDRFFKHRDLVSIISKHASTTAQEVVGHSVEGRELILLRLGNGPKNVFLWSQMHGDETTGTMAIMDLLNFLKHPAFASFSTEILSSCTLYLLPMVNPDGTERFTRRNAQQLDINRDYLSAKSTEAQILKAVHANIQPDFGFNLHDQSDLWGVQHTTNPAAVSFLAPAFDEGCSLNTNRRQAMQVIACMKASLDAQLPGKMGLFDDTYEPRAFGDNFQASGTATILIEGGTIIGDVEAQQVRKMVFGATLAGLKAISSAAYEAVPLDNYFNIPKNSKTLFHFIIHDIEVNGLKTSVGINYKPSPGVGGTQVDRFYTIEDIGDLHTMCAHEVFEAGTLQLEGSIVYDEPANFSLLRGKEPVLSFKNGILQSKVIF